MSLDEVYEIFKYRVVPPVFIVFFTASAQVLALVGRGESVGVTRVASAAFGSWYSWSVVGAFFCWAYLLLKVPSKKIEGPPTNDGYVPVYKDNGVLYYCVSVGVFIAIEVAWPGTSQDIYHHFPEILGSLNVAALLLCCHLFAYGHEDDDSKRLPRLYLFYRGVELHPRIMGVDVKQFTNCRVGLMVWQILILAFFTVSCRLNGFNLGCFVTTALQTIYLAKFFYWEGGYFHTLDIIMDRAGYYICWGCLVWVPSFYTFTSYYLVRYTPIVPSWISLFIGLLGVYAILINYRIDAQKQLFRSAKGDCQIWGRPAEYVKAKYTDAKGVERTSLLLTSGYWGAARHLNYTFELALALCWCLPGLGLGWGPFMYFFFLLYLLVHRCYRDEEKCRTKYGEYWAEYCSKVPYRMVPYVF